MKNFNQFILTLLAAGLFASCSLTEEPTSFVNRKSFYKNESQCIAALNSCYMPANAIYTANFMLVTEACTDIWYSSSTTVDACLDVTPAKPQYGKNVWTQGYKGVMYCNECVECISSADLAAGEIRGQKIDRRVQYFLGLGDLEAGETFKITHNYGVPWPGPKFWCPDIEQNYDSNNYRIFRYADAILMMAECYCNLENAEETMRYLNMVRQRAGVDPVTNFTGFEDLTLAVRCERARELGGEFQRKFDLVRWGIWYDQTYAYTNNATLKGKMRPCHRYYPIPDAQCALSGYVLTNDEYLADGL